MSKSLGNVVDPLEVIGQYGTDALRFTMGTGGSVLEPRFLVSFLCLIGLVAKIAEAWGLVLVCR